jgi:hypothetical protein
MSVFVKTCLLVSLLGACAIDEADAQIETPGADEPLTHAGSPPDVATAMPPQAEPAAAPGGQISAAGPCGESAAGQGWSSGSFTPPSGSTLEVEVYARVREPNFQRVDMVLGLGRGAVDAFSDLAAIVRFNPQGTVDARNGSVYQSVNAFTFRYNHIYAVRFVVDLAAKRYSAYIRTYDTPGPGDLIASSYAFRTEQAQTSSLDSFAHIVDSATGSLWACVQSIGP